MTTWEITENIKDGIKYGVPLHDLVQGQVLVEMLQLQDKSEDTPSTEYVEGYKEALQKVYAYVYALVFAKEDILKEAK